LKPAVTAERLLQAVNEGTVPEQLASFAPKSGDAVLIPAGIVHSLRDILVFEVQQNSDVTFRMYDWGQVDLQTGRARALHVAQAMACIDFGQGPVGPVTPLVQETKPVLRERLVQSIHFGITRICGQLPFIVGAEWLPRV